MQRVVRIRTLKFLPTCKLWFGVGGVALPQRERVTYLPRGGSCPGFRPGPPSSSGEGNLCWKHWAHAQDWRGGLGAFSQPLLTCRQVPWDECKISDLRLKQGGAEPHEWGSEWAWWAGVQGSWVLWKPVPACGPQVTFTLPGLRSPGPFLTE